MRTLPLVALVGLGSLAIGCGSPRGSEAPARRVDLRAAADEADLRPVGLAVDPTGAQFVFDEWRGLYRLTGDALTVVLPMAEMPDPGVQVRPPFTDLVAVAPGRFAITAIGDGYLLDLGARTLVRHFCYVPDELPEGLDQRTDALTYDPVADRLWAQPRTFDANGVLVASQLAAYVGTTGVDVGWYDVHLDLAAGGMAVVPGHGVVVGDRTQLHAFDGEQLAELDDLARFGVTSIAGLAVDAATDRLLVLDGDADALIEIDVAALGR